MNAVIPLHQHQHRTPTVSEIFTPHDIKVIRQSIGADCNDGEFDLFIKVAALQRLNPLKQQIIPLVFGKHERDPAKRKMRIVTTQAGMRAIAMESGLYHPAKPGDTKFTYTPREIARQKWLAEAAEIRDPVEYRKVMDQIAASMPPDMNNPAGLLECRTVVYKDGVPAEGIARWDEFAPMKPSDDCFEFVDTGDTWPNGKKKMRRRVMAGMNPLDHMVLDSSGLWGSKPTTMLHKCATVAALKAAYPDRFDGNFNTEETVEKDYALDLSANEILEIEEQERRARAVGKTEQKYWWDDGEAEPKEIPVGEFGDVVLKGVRACKYREDFYTLRNKTMNQKGLNYYWADHKADALDVIKQMNEIVGWNDKTKVAEKLPERPKPVTIEHEAQEGVPTNA